jgi:CubicO group peptidase (beta-lactamase class C family)
MRSLKLVASLLVVFSLVCAAQTQFPDTPAGKQCAAWLETFNRGDRAALKEFRQKNYPSRAQDQDVDRELDFRQRTGGFDLRKIEDSDPTKITVLVQERGSDQFARLTMTVQADEPHPIVAIEMRAIPRPEGFSLPHLSQSELLTATRKKIEEEVAADRFSGAVLIAKDGKPIFAEAYGLADRERKIPNTVKTRFRIGSMNKMFTAVATLQLAQSGKLDLKAPVGKYLTDYPNKEIASKVTIDQLLTHTGGTGDIFGPDFDAHRLELRTLQDYINLYGARAPKFEPGTKWEYSNYGFILLGAIVEKVSGESYYDYVHEHIFVPAGMTSTASDPEDKSVSDRSVGYTKMDSPELKPNTDTLPYRGTSAGGGYSTVEDLARFADALTSHKLLDASYTEMLTTGKPGTPDNSYGYGFEVSMENGARCFGHGGGAPGMNGDLKICPGQGYVVAVLANLDPPAVRRVSDFIANRLPEK